MLTYAIETKDRLRSEIVLQHGDAIPDVVKGSTRTFVAGLPAYEFPITILNFGSNGIEIFCQSDLNPAD